jgi:peroxiredoxin Q/BCP
MLNIGDTAPAWTAQDQDGKSHASAEYAGKWLLLYFYPKDDTPGCTAEACGFRDQYDKLKNRITVVGISSDSTDSHNEFAKKYSLPFTLLADPDHVIIKAFGADGIFLPKRVSFLIDPQGVIKKIYHSFDTKNHAEEILKDLDVLQI